MDAQEIRALLGKSIFERAQKYHNRILQSSCTTNEDGVRHLTALVQGSGPDCYYTQVWLRENGSFVSASCSCPYNQNGEGTYCKHIGALLLDENGAVHRIGCPKGKVVNSVGAGDSMVAGFVAGWMQTRSYSFALRLGTACGSATAFSLGLATKEKIDELIKEI